jgi:hypothetical protein
VNIDDESGGEEREEQKESCEDDYSDDSETYISDRMLQPSTTKPNREAKSVLTFSVGFSKLRMSREYTSF